MNAQSLLIVAKLAGEDQACKKQTPNLTPSIVDVLNARLFESKSEESGE